MGNSKWEVGRWGNAVEMGPLGRVDLETAYLCGAENRDEKLLFIFIFYQKYKFMLKHLFPQY